LTERQTPTETETESERESARAPERQRETEAEAGEMQPMEDGTLAEDGCGFTFVAPADDGVAPNVFVPHDCRCPITGDVMKDPVVAEDERSYEREQIVAWFRRCNDKGKPLTSPITGEEISERLTANHALKQATAELLARYSTISGVAESPHPTADGSPAGAVGTIYELGEIFGQLDPLRDLLA
jgi:hypothetical protein